MPKSPIEGIEKVVASLRQKALKASTASKGSVAVGYSASYAVHVHENLEALHTNGQAKFLTYPANKYKAQMQQIILGEMQKGKTVLQALLTGGLFLQKQSQLLVPVLTGNLKNSAYTRVDL